MKGYDLFLKGFRFCGRPVLLQESRGHLLPGVDRVRSESVEPYLGGLLECPRKSFQLGSIDVDRARLDRLTVIVQIFEMIMRIFSGSTEELWQVCHDAGFNRPIVDSKWQIGEPDWRVFLSFEWLFITESIFFIEISSSSTMSFLLVDMFSFCHQNFFKVVEPSRLL